MENSSGNHYMKELLDDEQFIRWILTPTQNSDRLWQERMDKNEELKKEIVGLKKILENLKAVEPEINVQDKEMVWKKIEAMTSSRNTRKRKALAWGISIAASLMLGIAGYQFFTAQEKVTEIVDYSRFSQVDDSLLKTDQINLVLSGDRHINIDKDSATITYDEKGGVQMDSGEDLDVSTSEPALNQLTVPYGKSAALVLSDGTKIRVNAGSRLVYPSVFSEDKREIYLTGEAFLEVAKNAKVPFIIQTDHVEFRVLGTVLNVSAYRDETIQSVVLVSGVVEVKSESQKNAYRLEPAQRFAYSTSSHEVNIQKVDVEEYIAWVSGYRILRNEKLPDALQKVARHFNVTFSYSREDLKDITVSGKLDLQGGLQNVLDNVSVTAPVQFRVDGNQVYVDRIK